ncbi:hypothetical protein DFH06DRAFT_1130505 [Mycena polygramma]|nr:hypothetical protein DFH06DRAFT_1130505 [Mycena polygramma]
MYPSELRKLVVDVQDKIPTGEAGFKLGVGQSVEVAKDEMLTEYAEHSFEGMADKHAMTASQSNVLPTKLHHIKRDPSSLSRGVCSWWKEEVQKMGFHYICRTEVVLQVHLELGLARLWISSTKRKERVIHLLQSLEQDSIGMRKPFAASKGRERFNDLAVVARLLVSIGMKAPAAVPTGQWMHKERLASQASARARAVSLSVEFIASERADEFVSTKKKRSHTTYVTLKGRRRRRRRMYYCRGPNKEQRSTELSTEGILRGFNWANWADMPHRLSSSCFEVGGDVHGTAPDLTKPNHRGGDRFQVGTCSASEATSPADAADVMRDVIRPHSPHYPDFLGISGIWFMVLLKPSGALSKR